MGEWRWGKWDGGIGIGDEEMEMGEWEMIIEE